MGGSGRRLIKTLFRHISWGPDKNHGNINNNSRYSCSDSVMVLMKNNITIDKVDKFQVRFTEWTKLKLTAVWRAAHYFCLPSRTLAGQCMSPYFIVSSNKVEFTFISWRQCVNKSSKSSRLYRTLNTCTWYRSRVISAECLLRISVEIKSILRYSRGFPHPSRRRLRPLPSEGIYIF